MTVSKEQALTALQRITLGSGQSLVEAGMVRQLEVAGEKIRAFLAVPEQLAQEAAAIRAAAEQALGELPGISAVQIDMPTGLPFSSPAPPTKPTWAEHVAGVGKVIAVASGKGGVGKSTVAANLALALRQQDHEVGLLDADIYGPSQQLLMGRVEPPEGDGDGKISPVIAAGGVKVMSLGYLIDVNQPVIWRGPMLMKALEQLIGDVRWGELDELVIDLPPGTGDVALTLCQNVPLAGAVIVTTPQDVALIDARKSLAMFARLEVPVLGIVENMASYRCPSCGHEEFIFGNGGGERTANELGVPFLGGIPLDPTIMAGGDAGTPVVLEQPDSAPAAAFQRIAAAISS